MEGYAGLFLVMMDLVGVIFLGDFFFLYLMTALLDDVNTLLFA